MAHKSRSPFGTMVWNWRRARGWTQARLAMEASGRLPTSETRQGLTDRSIGSFERKTADPAKWVVPRASNVEAIAAALEFPPGSSQHQELIAAAAATRRRAEPTAPAAPEARPEPARQSTSQFIRVGRETYLDQIAGHVQRAVEGTPQAVVVTSVGGSGKTELVLEASRLAVEQHPDLVVLWGSCSARMASPEPFWGVRQVLRTMVGDIRSAVPRTLISAANQQRIADRLAITLEALDTTDRDLIPRLIPATAFDNDLLRQRPDLLPTAQSLAAQPPGQQHGEPIDSLQHLIHTYTTAGPVMMVIEDVHDADASILTLLATMLRQFGNTTARILLVLTTRPATPGIAPDAAELDLQQALDDLYPGSAIRLSDALEPQAAEAFVRAYAADLGLALTPAETQRVRELTQGLPIFVEGLLQLVQIAAPGFETTALFSPITKSGMFEAELNMLSPATRKALVAASVQGDTFALEVLGLVTGSPPDDLAATFSKAPAWIRGLVQPGGISTLAGQEMHEFQFSHALVREHLYANSLSDIERAHLHQQTADALITLFGTGEDEVSGLIATHLEAAGERRQAAEFWLRSGHFLMSRHEYDAAEAAFRRIRALHLRLELPILEAEALLGLGTCARETDRHTEATEWIERGLDFARRRHVLSVEGRLLSQLGMLAYDAGHVERGAMLLREAIAIHQRNGDLAEAARSLARLSHNLYGLGRYDDAMVEAQRGIDLATELGDTNMINGARIALANCWLDVARYADAIALYEVTLQSAQEVGDVHRANICRLNLTLCHIERGELTEAAAWQAPFRDRRHPVVPRFMGVAEFQFGLVAEAEGRLDDAFRHFAASRLIRQRNGQEALAIDALAGMVRVSTARREIAAIRQELAELQAELARHGLNGIEHGARVFLALIMAGQALGNQDLVQRSAAEGVAFLHRRAGALVNADDQHRYLHHAPTNRQLLALAKTLQADWDHRSDQLASG